MKTLVLIFFSTALSCSILAQESIVFEASCSRDTILQGNAFELSYTLKNAKSADFPQPELDQFLIVGGPNHSSSMSFVNGEFSSETQLTYLLQANELGEFTIPSLTVQIEDAVYTTEEKRIVVIPNEQNLRVSPYKEEQKKKDLQRLNPLLPEKKVRKKRKVYKI